MVGVRLNVMVHKALNTVADPEEMSLSGGF